ncbi:ATP-binding protein [Azospirillum sp. SYSU D00513]|uniref:hybrid sensor histidine kinase/response regulator n=1 Tax=Azospirillum sp. SYSU D00513 TaxID=2812561 RepID=UPI001A967699|nr:ATP-binding protein [Azospirillum sp. SYSU D00513]
MPPGDLGADTAFDPAPDLPEGPTPPSAAVLLRCLEGLDMGVVIVDARAAILYWNHWMSRHSGVPRRSAVGARLEALFPSIAQGRLAGAVEDAIATGLSAYISNSVNASLFPLLRNDGIVDEPVAQSIVVRPVQVNGATGCLIQVFDESASVARERKLREQRNARYHAVIEAAQDSFVTIDESGIIQWINPAAERKFGRRLDDLLGSHVSLLLPAACDASAFDGGLTEMTLVDVAGRAFDAEISTSHWTSNGVRCHTLFIRDVTERNQAAEELRQSQRMQSLGKLVGGIAHEFNNLLMVIRANVELLKSDLGDAELRDFADEIAQAANRGATLTNGLLSFARKQPLRPETLALADVVEQTLRLAAPTLGALVSCKVEQEGGTLHVEADRTQLQNAILNLLFNARDAMPLGGSIRIVLASDEEERFCRIRVADTGLGMPPDVLERACEPFFSTKDAGRGTGLGLSMVMGFVRQSGGRFELESEPGRGTAATAWLPRVRAAAAAREGGAEEDTPPPLPPRRILLVEDDPQVRSAVQAMLGGAGHAVTAVEDGFEALELLDAEGFDLLVSDVVLPRGMSGALLAREARLAFPGLPVVLMSGYNELDPAMTAAITESVDILRKPFSRPDLERVMRAALVAR